MGILNLFGLELRRTGKDFEDLASPQSIINAEINEMVTRWTGQDDRKSIYDDIDRMARNDEYVAEALDILVADILPIKNQYDSMFEIICDDEKLKAEVKRIIKQSRIEGQLKNIIYNYLKYGNAFLEFVVYENKKFSHLQFIPQVWSIYRNVDLHGKLRTGEPKVRKINHCAFDQRDDTGNFLVGFFPYQIVQLRSTPWDKEGHGQPFLEATRKNWLRIHVLEDAMAIARIVRAYMRMIHYIPVSDKASNRDIKRAIKNYRKSILEKEITSIADGVLKKTRVPYPMNVSTDLFVPVSENLKGDVKTIDPSNTQLSNLADMEYFLNRLFARLKVPKARLANEADVRAKATMAEINTAYASTITSFQIDVVQGIVDAVTRALFLEGYPVWDSDKVNYKIALPSPFVKNELDRAKIDNIEAAVVDKYVKANVLSRDTARKTYLNMDEKESETEAEKVVADLDTFPTKATGAGLFASQVKTDEVILESLQCIMRELEKNDGRVHTEFPYRD